MSIQHAQLLELKKKTKKLESTGSNVSNGKCSPGDQTQVAFFFDERHGDLDT